MTVNHAVGEIGITLGESDVTFRPSLLAISRIGSPKDIIETFVTLLEPPRHDFQAKRQFRAALHTMSCCAGAQCDLENLDQLIGIYTDSAGELVYQAGVMPTEDIVTIAQHLIRHGVAGVSPKGDEPMVKGEPMREFDAAKFAAMAVAHLGMSESDAWSLTMTSLLSALHSKFPPDKSSAASITEKQYTDSMDWLKRVNAQRNAKEASNG